MSKNYDYVLQQNSNDCGIACIITILKYYGIHPSREKIIEKTAKKCNGYTAYDLLKVSKSYGIESMGIKCTLKDIKKLPVIAHTIKDKNMFHFIVIFEINNNKKILKILDPAEGIKTITFEEFEEITTNIFLIFEGKKQKKVINTRFKKEIIKIFQNNKRIILKTIFLSIIYVVLSLMFNYYLKLVLEYNDNLKLLFFIFLIFCNITLLKNILSFLKNRLILKLNIQIDQEITNKVSNHVLNLPYEYFASKTTGELITIIEDTENFKEIITKIFILGAVDFLLITIILLYIMYLNIYIGITLIVIIITLLIITKKYQYIFNDSYLKYKINRINYTSKLINYLTSFITIKNLNITNKISMLINKEYNQTLKSDKKYTEKYYNYSFIVTLFIDMFYLMFIFISSYIAIKSGIELLDVVLFSSYFYLITGLLNNINESISLYKVYQTSTDRVLECLDLEEEKFLKTSMSEIKKIEYKNISFYQNNQLLLDKINFQMNKGDKIFITGESGIGKSTMMKMLLRYLKPNEGSIYIDNLDINDIDLTFIRSNITYISQEEELFPGTIMDNFKLIEENEAVIKKRARITLLEKSFEENNIDYNYLVEESGTNLSGGERKKIILTRGLLHFKNVLILDEVFNEISVEEEREILTNLFASYQDKIIIMISHRNNNQKLFNKKYKLKGDGILYEIK